MRTALFLGSGFLMLAAFCIWARLFSENFPAAASWATGLFLVVWLAITGFNMWVGVNHAGYSVQDELPILLLVFAVPAALAAVAIWRLS